MLQSTVGPVRRQGVKNVSNPVVKQSYGQKTWFIEGMFQSKVNEKSTRTSKANK